VRSWRRLQFIRRMVWSRECNAVDQVVIRYPSDTTASHSRKLRDRRSGVSTSAAARAGVQPESERRASSAFASVVRRALVHAPGCYGRLGYVAYPELEADTLAFYALPGAVVGAGREGVERHLISPRSLETAAS